MFLPAFFSISIFLGSIIRYLLEKKFPNWMKNYFVALASGGIVGEAMIGVLIPILIVSGVF